jgi:lysophospholipid acyltransferase (LPLAT)-like uncharacterized protein
LGKPVFKQAQYYIDRQQTDTANSLARQDLPAPGSGHARPDPYGTIMTTKPDPKTDFSSVETRRSMASARRMSAGRRLLYFLSTPLLRGLLALLWHSYRVEKIIGADVGERLIADKTACIPCYWHQQHQLCANMIRQWIQKGFDVSILVSASVDGEIPARIAGAWGADIIRGSANQTGALVMRDMRGALQRGKSIIMTPDGPNGPPFEFKAGNILMARISEAPLVPLACAADRTWHLTGWDKMMIPKPFARVVIAIGEPYFVPGDTPLGELEVHRVKMQDALMRLMDESQKVLDNKGNADG